MGYINIHFPKPKDIVPNLFPLIIYIKKFIYLISIESNSVFLINLTEILYSKKMQFIKKRISIEESVESITYSAT